MDRWIRFFRKIVFGKIILLLFLNLFHLTAVSFSEVLNEYLPNNSHNTEISKDIRASMVSKEIKTSDGSIMVLIPAGWFIMGSSIGDDDQKPRRRVYLDDFYIDKYPVTNEQFGPPEKDHGRKFLGKRSPVVGVSWFMARDYCRSFDKRLPTEAEWEKAARGIDGRIYPWGNDWNGLNLIWGANSRNKIHPVDRTFHTHETPFGVFDMVGHVWEWVTDRYEEKYYQRASNKNPKGPQKGAARVLRGGSWALRHKRFFRAAHRTAVFPTTTSNDAGFRCAKDAK